MKTIYKVISFVALIAMFVSSIMVFNGSLERKPYECIALVGTVVWFVTVPFWMKRRLGQSE